MEIFKVLIYSLIIGGLLMVLGIAMICLILIINSLFPKTIELTDKIYNFFEITLYSGLLIFYFSLSGSMMYLAIEGINDGKYNLAFSRYSSYKTNISFDKQPIRFLIQTAGFIGFSICIFRFSVKMLINKYKNKKITKK